MLTNPSSQKKKRKKAQICLPQQIHNSQYKNQNQKHLKKKKKKK